MREEQPYSLVEQYYRKSIPSEQERFLRGQIYSCPCLYFRPEIEVLNLKLTDPDHKDAFFEVRRTRVDKFGGTTHKPVLIPRLELEADEELVAFRTKKRKVIVFSSNTEKWPLRSGQYRDECYLVLPMFSFHEGDNQEWKLRLRAYGYKELFYLPERKDLGLIEGYVRFDQTQVVPKEWLSRENCCLSEEAQEYLTRWFLFYLTGIADAATREVILAYRDESLRKIEEAFGNAKT